MAGIRKMPNGNYKATVYVGRDANGKMLRKYVTRESLKECKAAARELEQQIEEKTLTNISGMRLSVYMDKWLEVTKPMLASTTIKAYKMYINAHFKPYFGNLKVDQITDMHIKEYLALKLQTLSSTTVRKHYFTLSKLFHEALKSKSPCNDIKAPQNATYKPKVPTSEQFNLIWNTFKEISKEDEAAILLAGWCGLRRGEVFALKWDDIDKAAGTIRVDEAVALEEDSYEFEYKDPKSNNGIRTLAVPDYLMNLFEEIRQERKKFSHNIVSYNPHSFTKKYSKIIKEKKLPKVRYHDLRHYHAVFLYENGIPDLYAAERLGHDIWVLKKIYQHLGIEKKKEFDEKIKDLFKQG